jgi:hypothetical protein
MENVHLKEKSKLSPKYTAIGLEMKIILIRKYENGNMSAVTPQLGSMV